MHCDAPYLDQILPLGLGHERLELGGGEGVDQTRLGDDEEEDLRSGEDRQLVCLLRRRWVSNCHAGEGRRDDDDDATSRGGERRRSKDD
jgi:hypothetical protein